ncbi:hypothetical protein TNIN_282061 [Trichonephila inaurata madagascariensis]|uniref:Uncharacterized protein n=1 Tax=Trichonephila inaurata madagascariensis TaxID=2747483 RepID=A0A8X6XEV6_9ARAC|nr:hypothetical protein TNIN_282061 [Trichonephila inaurata madagascariensis]
MNSHIISVALVLFLYVAKGFAQSDDKESRNEEFLTIVNCVSESGDQDLCDDLLDCIDLEAKPFKDGYDNCTAILFPDGIGECTESQELHHSADDRKQDCIEDLGDACFDQQN